MAEQDSFDLGFTFRQLKGGEVQVLQSGRLASTLRGTEAIAFLAEVQSNDFAGVQQIMARLTGNYKRGNERLAGNHSRNRRK